MATFERRRLGTPTVRVLDPDLLHTRRLALGLEQQRLADLISLSSGEAIRRLERGSNQAQMTLVMVALLADALGLSVGELLVEPEQSTHTAAPDDDAATVGAILSSADVWVPVDELAVALDWPRPRTVDALTELEARLRAAGQRLAWVNDHDVRITPGLDTEPLAHVAATNISYRGLRLDEAREMYALLGGPGPGRTTTSRLYLNHMRAAGLIAFVDPNEPGNGKDVVELTAESRFNLCLDEVPG